MVNYNEGKIYFIGSKYTDKIYVGSTCLKLNQRFICHKNHYKLNYKQSSNKILKYNDCQIYLLEKVKCNNKKELCEKERYYIELFDTVNKQIPNRTKKEYEKEYYHNNKEKKEKYKKQYYQNNKEKLNKSFQCECGGSYVLRNKKRHYKSIKHINYVKCKK